EASVAARLLGHAAVAGALDRARWLAGRDVGDRADVAQAGAGRGLGAQLGEVLAVGGVLARVAGGAHAGAAAQRLGLDPRIVGDRGAVGGLGRSAGLDQRVLLERVAGLGRELDLVAERLELHDRQQTLELAELVGVAGREHDGGGHGFPAPTRRWPGPVPRAGPR